MHAWDVNNISKIATAVGEEVEVDDDVEELLRLDRARVLIKTPRKSSIQHMVVVSINGEVFTIHLVEETCYNPCRHKCLTGCSLGSSNDVSFVESDMALLAWSECASSEAEIRLENRQLDDDGGNQTRRDSEQQKTDGQRNKC